MNNSYKTCFFIFCCTILLSIGLTTAQAAPVNDNIADATTITSDIGSTSANNFEATPESGEPGHASASPYASVWFAWTAPTTDSYYFNTFGSLFDTTMAAYDSYSGTLASLNKLAENDDYTVMLHSQSRISFAATSGTTYHIAVDGYNGDTGYIALNWCSTAKLPDNDLFGSPTNLPSNPSGTVSGGTNINATPDDVSIMGGIGDSSSIWFTWDAPSDGDFIFNTLGSDYDTTIGAYTGPAVDNLTLIAQNDDIDIGNDQSRISFTATNGTTYRIVVDGYSGLQGNVTLNWLELPGKPINDNFASATPVSGKYGTYANAFTFLATKETEEPTHFTTDTAGPYASIWFKWTAPFTRNVTFDTFGSDFDTTMSAYTGMAVNNLTKLAENDDAGTGTQSSITFPVVFGTTYYIAVDGYENAEGNVILNWQMKFPWILFNPPITGGAKP